MASVKLPSTPLGQQHPRGRPRRAVLPCALLDPVTKPRPGWWTGREMEPMLGAQDEPHGSCQPVAGPAVASPSSRAAIRASKEPAAPSGDQLGGVSEAGRVAPGKAWRAADKVTRVDLQGEARLGEGAASASALSAPASLAEGGSEEGMGRHTPASSPGRMPTPVVPAAKEKGPSEGRVISQGAGDNPMRPSTDAARASADAARASLDPAMATVTEASRHRTETGSTPTQTSTPTPAASAHAPSLAQDMDVSAAVTTLPLASGKPGSVPAGSCHKPPTIPSQHPPTPALAASTPSVTPLGNGDLLALFLQARRGQLRHPGSALGVTATSPAPALSPVGTLVAASANRMNVGVAPGGAGVATGLDMVGCGIIRYHEVQLPWQGPVLELLAALDRDYTRVYERSRGRLAGCPPRLALEDKVAREFGARVAAALRQAGGKGGGEGGAQRATSDVSRGSDVTWADGDAGERSIDKADDQEGGGHATTTGMEATLQALRAAYLLQTTALNLVQYGVRLAHLHLLNHLGVLAPMRHLLESPRLLSRAFHAVERGEMEESPKHALLRKIISAHVRGDGEENASDQGGVGNADASNHKALIGRTASVALPRDGQGAGPGTLRVGDGDACRSQPNGEATSADASSPILVIADPCAFFTLYGLLARCGRRPFHFDRDGQLLGAGGRGPVDVNRLGAAVTDALHSGADCLLVGHQYLVESFPFSRFSLAVLYTPDKGREDALHHEGATCERHVLVTPRWPPPASAIQGEMDKPPRRATSADGTTSPSPPLQLPPGSLSNRAAAAAGAMPTGMAGGQATVCALDGATWAQGQKPQAGEVLLDRLAVQEAEEGLIGYRHATLVQEQGRYVHTQDTGMPPRDGSHVADQPAFAASGESAVENCAPASDRDKEMDDGQGMGRRMGWGRAPATHDMGLHVGVDARDDLGGQQPVDGVMCNGAVSRGLTQPAHHPPPAAPSLARFILLVNVLEEYSSVVASRRELFQSVARLEGAGVQLVERELPAVDMILDAATCLVVYTGNQLMPEEDGEEGQAMGMQGGGGGGGTRMGVQAGGGVGFMPPQPHQQAGGAGGPSACAPGGRPAAGQQAAAAAAALDTIVSHLRRLSFSFSGCVLVLEDCSAWLHALRGKITATAAVTGLTVQTFSSTGPDMTQSIVLRAIHQAMMASDRLLGSGHGRALGSSGGILPLEYVRMPEVKSAQEHLLTHFVGLNPLSAHAILSCGVSLPTFLSASLEDQMGYTRPFLVPERCLRLFNAQFRARSLIQVGPQRGASRHPIPVHAGAVHDEAPAPRNILPSPYPSQEEGPRAAPPVGASAYQGLERNYQGASPPTQPAGYRTRLPYECANTHAQADGPRVAVPGISGRQGCPGVPCRPGSPDISELMANPEKLRAYLVALSEGGRSQGRAQGGQGQVSTQESGWAPPPVANGGTPLGAPAGVPMPSCYPPASTLAREDDDDDVDGGGHGAGDDDVGGEGLNDHDRAVGRSRAGMDPSRRGMSWHEPARWHGDDPRRSSRDMPAAPAMMTCDDGRPLPPPPPPPLWTREEGEDEMRAGSQRAGARGPWVPGIGREERVGAMAATPRLSAGTRTQLATNAVYSAQVRTPGRTPQASLADVDELVTDRWLQGRAGPSRIPGGPLAGGVSSASPARYGMGGLGATPVQRNEFQSSEIFSPPPPRVAAAIPRQGSSEPPQPGQGVPAEARGSRGGGLDTAGYGNGRAQERRWDDGVDDDPTMAGRDRASHKPPGPGYGLSSVSRGTLASGGVQGFVMGGRAQAAKNVTAMPAADEAWAGRPSRTGGMAWHDMRPAVPRSWSQAGASYSPPDDAPRGPHSSSHSNVGLRDKSGMPRPRQPDFDLDVGWSAQGPGGADRMPRGGVNAARADVSQKPTSSSTSSGRLTGYTPMDKRASQVLGYRVHGKDKQTRLCWSGVRTTKSDDTAEEFPLSKRHKA
eukprot:jgi/Mesvir1/18357/Mv14252-RA.3